MLYILRFRCSHKELYRQLASLVAPAGPKRAPRTVGKKQPPRPAPLRSLTPAELELDRSTFFLVEARESCHIQGA